MVPWPVLGVHSQRCQGPTTNMQISDSTAGNPSGTCQGGRDTSRKTGRRRGIAAGGKWAQLQGLVLHSVQAGTGLEFQRQMDEGFAFVISPSASLCFCYVK